MKMQKLLLLSLSFIISIQLFSQEKKDGIPISQKLRQKELKQDIPIIRMPQLKQEDIDKIKAKNEIDGEKFRFAHGFDTNINVKEKSVVDSLEDGMLYRLKIKSVGAKSLNVIFGSYNLPNGAELFLYDTDYNFLRGKFSSHNNKSSGKLAVQPIKGDETVIEYFEPFNKTRYGNLVISKVSHDIYGVEDGRFGLSGDCQVDINCSEGNTWQDEKQSVVRLLINGTGFCSGTLMNNTSLDGTPYILTAAHCLCEQEDAENTVFVFNYESPSCDGIDGSVANSISGSDLRATSIASDFTLLELSTRPNQAFGAYYAGWDRRNIRTTGGVGIHHPLGDVKKYLHIILALPIQHV